jgi:hypothetical protein
MRRSRFSGRTLNLGAADEVVRSREGAGGEIVPARTGIKNRRANGIGEHKLPLRQILARVAPLILKGWARFVFHSEAGFVRLRPPAPRSRPRPRRPPS